MLNEIYIDIYFGSLYFFGYFGIFIFDIQNFEFFIIVFQLLFYIIYLMNVGIVSYFGLGVFFIEKIFNYI